MTVLAVVLPLLFVVALVARTPIPRDELESSRRATMLGRSMRTAQLGDDLWSGLSIRTATRRSKLMLEPLESIHQGDPLVYLLPPDASIDGGDLPAGARLLGPLTGQQSSWFNLPREVRVGRFVLYDLATRSVISEATIDLDAAVETDQNR